MTFKLTFTLILLFSSKLFGQTEIRGSTKIKTDGMVSDAVYINSHKEFEKRIKIKPINKSKSYLEIRFYKLNSLSNTTNLKIIKLKDGKWVANEYDELNRPVKIKKYSLKYEHDFQFFITKLLSLNISTLPSQNELKNKMRVFFNENGRQGEKKIIVNDGESYSVEFKIKDKFRIFDFDNPDEYADFYNNVDELKNYVAIKNLFDKELTRK